MPASALGPVVPSPRRPPPSREFHAVLSAHAAALLRGAISVAPCMTSHAGLVPHRALSRAIHARLPRYLLYLEPEQQSGCLERIRVNCRARLHHQAGHALPWYLSIRWNARGMAVRIRIQDMCCLFKLESRVGLLEVACIRPSMPSRERSPLQPVCRQMPLAHMAHFPRATYRYSSPPAAFRPGRRVEGRALVRGAH